MKKIKDCPGYLDFCLYVWTLCWHICVNSNFKSGKCKSPTPNYFINKIERICDTFSVIFLTLYFWETPGLHSSEGSFQDIPLPGEKNAKSCSGFTFWKQHIYLFNFVTFLYALHALITLNVNVNRRVKRVEVIRIPRKSIRNM